MCCLVEYMVNNMNLYKVTIYNHHLFGLFTTKNTYINLTKENVENMKIPYCKIIKSTKGPTDVFPKRFI